MAELEDLSQEWTGIASEFRELEEKHEEYLRQLDELQKQQATSSKGVHGLLKRVGRVKEALRHVRPSIGDAAEQSNVRLRDIQADATDVKVRLSNMLEELPRATNGLYLSIILGSLDVSLTSKDAKFQYKESYELFKIKATTVALVLLALAFLLPFRALDAIAFFFLVWYYCTLTIRESILRINGSKIKGWWVLHHYASTVLAAVTLIWPDGVCYQHFRRQFLVFSMYIAVVQLLQCQYQRGCLRRLRSLGQRHSMDITVEGFHSWMFKGLSFLLPFLVLGYVFQLFNAYTLFKIQRAFACAEWQVLCLAALFFMLAVGNSVTTFQVCWRKVGEKEKMGTRARLQTKYSIHVPRTDATSD